MLQYLKQESNKTFTENGAVTYSSTLSDCLDLFATVGALRRESEEEIVSRFMRAYTENKDVAMKLLFFARDIRGGLGERRVFRTIIRWLSCNETESLRKNLHYIAEYGRFDDLMILFGTLKELEKEFEAKAPSMPRELCFLYGTFMEDYIHDLNICQQFAKRNREKMAAVLLERTGLVALESFQTIHNYIDVDEKILRKGSVSAKQGEKLLIPINMRDGSLICIGKGNPDWNYSAPHGAGRIMSRSAAFERLTMEEYQREMSGIYTTCVNTSTLDESPMAYKNMDEIVANIEPAAEIIAHIKPIYNFKAAE